MAVIQVCYRSRIIPQDDSRAFDGAIKRLLADARLRNAQCDVTGALLLADGFFFQTLEGPADTVDGLFARITRDGRHSDVTLLRRGDAEKRLFPGRPLYFSKALDRSPAAPRHCRVELPDPLVVDGTELTSIFGALAHTAELRRAHADARLL